MVLNLSVPELKELKPKITVFGVGGAGGNAINNMISAGLAGVEFVAANTDAQALSKSLSDSKMQLGVQITKGLGAGSHPDIGKSSADETKHEIMERLEGTNMLFITAGMGGGTGTGAAPVIARVAKELGILTVAVVTKPFQFEGAGRMRIAEQGLKELECLVDTTIVIPNQNLFRVADEKTTFADAFAMADEVLHAGVRSITDLMVVPGLINLDFADVKTIMNNMGRAMMGTGQASGENRAIDCARAAVANPLLDDYSLDGAKGLLINITGGTDLTLHEVDKITNEIREQVHPDADVIVGSIFDESLEGSARVSVVATGLDTTPRPTKSVIDLHVSTNAVMSNSSTSQSENIQSIRSENTDSVEASSEPYVYIDETEEARLAEEAEQARIAEEAEQARIAEEARLAEEAEQARIAEEAEQARIAEEARLAEEAEQARIAEEAEQARIVEEAEQARIVEEARLAEEAEQARIAEEAEQARIAEEARLAEEAEQARIAEEAEQARIAEEARLAEEAEQARIAEEAEQARIAEEAEQARIAEEARLAEELEEEKLSQEQSIFDLIDDDTGHDQDNPSLFSEVQKSEDDQDNIHELEITQDQEDDVEVSAEEILDEEILEIPAFLRRQSK